MAGRVNLQLVLHTAHALEARVEADLGAIGLSGAKLAALTALSEAGESMPLGQLAERLSCVKSNITQLVDRLEADGLVARQADASDRRSRLAALTPAGRKAAKAGAQVLSAAERDVLGGLTGDEARQLGALLGKIAAR